MAKRLRGWQLEKEMERPREPLEKEGGSQLATALLALWAHGKLSGTTIRWLAECATLDGATHADLVSIARCGSHGVHPGNIHRDLMVSFCKGIDIAVAHEVNVPCKNSKTLKKDETMSAVFLPHQMFAKLAQYPCFPELFPTENLKKFWETAEQTGDDRLLNHPMKVRGWKATTIPIFLHGDGVEYVTNRDSLMVYSWGNVLAQKESLCSHFLIASFPKSITVAGTWDAMWCWISWSLAALQVGLHPTHDPWGKALKKDSPFFLEKGKPLAHGLKAVLWSIQGDHEFFSLHLKLPHWASKQPCWECNASKEANPVKLWYKTLEKGKQGFKHISNEEAKEHPRSAHSLFSGQVPGLTTKMVRGDCLHIIFTKGVLGHLLGGIIHYLCYYNGPGVTQVIPPEARLGAIFEALNKEYQKQGSPTRVSNLRLSMVTDPKTPHASYATLDLKAAETKHFLHAFIPVAEEILEKGEAHEKAMLEAMECMSQLTLIFDQADAFLSEVEWAHAMSLATSFLSRYEYLSAWALEKGGTLFNKVMKFHTFQHLVENSRFLNPRVHWCFASEDFVGKVSTLTVSVNSGVASTKLSTKLAPKYRILLHFLLTRPHMQDAGKNIEP